MYTFGIYLMYIKGSAQIIPCRLYICLINNIGLFHSISFRAYRFIYSLTPQQQPADIEAYYI